MWAVRDKSLLAMTMRGLIFKRNTVFLKIQNLRRNFRWTLEGHFFYSNLFESVALSHILTKAIENVIIDPLRLSLNLGQTPGVLHCAI